MKYANHYDLALFDHIQSREEDWRCGAVVYQVLVDRFAPSDNLDNKRSLYTAPKVLKSWHETPVHGVYLEDEQLWSHEIEFWGGDLASLTAKLDYVQQLGVDVLYLNPIHKAYTNHKYDALDYQQVSEEFGDRDDVAHLANELHALGMKLVLDGVFNHLGRNSPVFIEAERDPLSEYRQWFEFHPEYPGGARCWENARNLPELEMEHPQVKSLLYANEDSVMQSYLLEGVDGWRLDVAHDIGFNLLQEMTDAAHKAKKDSLVVGEIWSYPKEWFPCVDGVMNFTFREIIIHLCQGKIAPAVASNMLFQLIGETDYNGLLRSWLVLDNHDTPRLPHLLPERWRQKMAQVLQFALPGAPNLYYGSEIGMDGGHDPEMRAPMRWDWVTGDNEYLTFTRQLIQLRKQYPALRIGNCRQIHSENLLAFERYTHKVEDSVFVFVNPTDKPVNEYVMLPNSKLMNCGKLTDILSNCQVTLDIKASVVEVNLEPGQSALFNVDVGAITGYTTYKRVL